ncbi:hypothetical protein B0H63DRAFT_516741 [Podospora didyma]|uniref:Protein YAE1 n=1 Tax=Podospora didyma TaxID=330526 RepID=A0AAE0P5W4_9PEZI|nr:hypothetical protein B0H63DRAFT_516741 [Podospora didyma]
MLLRNPDPDVFRTMDPAHDDEDMPPPPPQGYHEGHTDNNANDEGDDLDDIWEGDANTHDDNGQPTAAAVIPPSNTHRHHQQHNHPSDVPRLQQEHTTAGYRDGIATAKGASAQSGFDEGFGLGATIGAQAGQLLGMLEGLLGAVASSSASKSHSYDEKEISRLQDLLAEARRELSVQSVFGEAYWAMDGTWNYDIPEPAVSTATPEEDDDGEEPVVVFVDVAAAHPLLAKWDGIIRAEADRYGINWDVIPPADDASRRDEDERENDAETRRKDAKAAAAPATAGERDARGVLAW